jgi:uncharacterized RDD family membrane protein YckC
MITKITPLHISGLKESIYAGFGSRFGSFLLDFVIFIPLIVVTLAINSINKDALLYTATFNLILGIFYNIYLVKKYGGTPGKLWVGLKIIKINGEDIGWREAILRHLVMFLITISMFVVNIISILQADAEYYEGLTWIQKSQYLAGLNPVAFSINTWLSNIWIYGEFIVLLTNERKRAVHDFIAGTVVIKGKYHNEIKKEMSADNSMSTEFAIQ